MINTIDLFAGCGGLMDGFEQSGKYRTLACVEWEPAPCQNLAKRLKNKWNYENADEMVLRFDIQRTDELFSGWNDPAYGTSAGLDALASGGGHVDMIIGGPPCQAYSIAGRIRDENGMRNDYRNYLFESYIKVVKQYRPKAFLFENVPGILSAQPGGFPIIDAIKKTFDEAGYVVLTNLKKAVLDFSEFGIPQNRSRIIILGLSKDVYGERASELLDKFYDELLPQYKCKKKKTVKDAIGDLPALYPLLYETKIDGRKSSHSVSDAPVFNHQPRWHSKRDIEIFRKLELDIESGANQYVSTEALKKLYEKETGHTSNVHKYYVLRWNEPSNLIPAHLYKDGLRHIHPSSAQARSITVREAARLQTFADDYEFIGSQMDQYKMIGNAVPPAMSKILAAAVWELLFKED